MSKFACPERRLSCGKGCANALLPEARKHLPIGDPEGDRVTSDLDPSYLSLERQPGFEACWFRRSPCVEVTGLGPLRALVRTALRGAGKPSPSLFIA